MELPPTVANYLQSQSRASALVQGVILVGLIGFIDYLTGYEVTVFPFYSIPILLLVWRGDISGSIGLAVLSATTWWAADALSGHFYSHEWLHIWDAIVRLIFFCLVIVAGAALKNRGDANRAQIELLERSTKLEQQIIEISEREQQRLGRDLHDGLCQYLASVGFSADALQDRLTKAGTPYADAAGDLSRLIEDAVIRARDIARGLSPVDRDEGGLESALEELAASTSRLVGISCSFIADTPPETLENERAVDLFRIAQEALSNAVKHSRAKHVVIALEISGDDLALRVSDDGIGFDPTKLERSGMGLNIMRYRARQIGGILEIFNNTPTGAVVSCTIKGVRQYMTSHGVLNHGT
ncbi:MAG TPA: sensor histidine kinase [Chthoniobacteraceae bacterium]